MLSIILNRKLPCTLAYLAFILTGLGCTSKLSTNPASSQQAIGERQTLAQLAEETSVASQSPHKVTVGAEYHESTESAQDVAQPTIILPSDDQGTERSGIELETNPDDTLIPKFDDSAFHHPDENILIRGQSPVTNADFV